MFFTKFALQNTRMTILFIGFVFFVGIATYLTYPSQEDPQVTVRDALIMAFYPGMSPTRVENLISRKIEEKVREIPEIERIDSTSSTGQSIVHVKVWDKYFDMPAIWQKVRNKMNDIGADLPKGTIGPIVNDEYGLVSVATIALLSDGFSLAQMRETSRWVRDRLYSVSGVKKVQIYGIQNEEIYLETTNARLAQFGMNPAQLIHAIQQQNIVLAGGRVDAAGENVVLEPSGNFSSVKDIENVVLAVPGTKDVVYLRDVVDVKRDYVDPPDRPVYYNGQQAIMLSVAMVEGENIVEFGGRLTAKVHELENSLPIGYSLKFTTYQPDLVANSIADFSSNVYQTLGIVLVVVCIFLGMRTGLIVGTMVPLAVLFAIIVMRLADIPLHRVSLAALIISVGLLVDNGIVMAEDIRNRLMRGVSKVDAAVQAAGELATPLLTSSLTTILAFMPLMLATDVSGEYCVALSIVVAITLLGSWMMALLVTPAMCVWFMKVPAVAADGPQASEADDSENFDSGLYRAYRGVLAGLMRVKLLFLGAMVAALFGGLWLLGQVPFQFFPDSDRNQFLIYVDMPAGTNVRTTREQTLKLVNFLNDEKANPDLVQNIAYVADGGPRFFLSLNPLDPADHRAFIVVDTKPETDTKATIDRVKRQIAAKFPAIRARVKTLFLGPSENGVVQIRVVGSDADHITKIAEQVKQAMRAMPGAEDIKDNWENRTLTIDVKIDQDRAAQAGVTSLDIAESLNGYLSGTTVTRFREGDKLIPITLRAEAAQRFNLGAVRNLNVYSSSRGEHVPILQVATFEPRALFDQIQRRNMERTVKVEAKSALMTADAMYQMLKPQIDKIDLAGKARLEVGGEIEDSEKGVIALSAYMPHCLAMMIVLLVWQFNSFRRPLIIAMTIPLVVIGAAIGLYVFKAPFGFMPVLGLLSLAGIIINNAIVLIDRVDLERAAGVDTYNAIILAAQKRFQPILMTTLTTILGLVPLALFGGELWFGMAIVMMFGLAVGTVLTLCVVPVLYALLFRVRNPRRGVAPADLDGAAAVPA